MNVVGYQQEDAQAVLDFSRTLPDDDRNFLKEDTSDPGVVQSWSDHPEVRRYLVWSGDSAVGYVALHPLGGWCSHVAEMRVVVSPQARGQGIGQHLVRQALIDAVNEDIIKVVTEVVADDDQAIGMLQANGFAAEAILADHVRDRSGQLRDLLLMTCRTDELLGGLAMSGISDALELGG